MMMMVLLGGGMFMCSLCSAGLFLAYKMNPDLFDFGLFGTDGGGDGVSASAGGYVCPRAQTIDGIEFTWKRDSTSAWAKDHGEGSTEDGVSGFTRRWCKREGNDNVVYSLASKLPADAKPGEVFNNSYVLKQRGGIFGPGVTDKVGYNPSNPTGDYAGLESTKNESQRRFKYIASSSTKAPK